MKKLTHFMVLGLVCGLLIATLVACSDPTATPPSAATTSPATALVSPTAAPPPTVPITALPASSATPLPATTASAITAKTVTGSGGVTSEAMPLLPGASAIINPAGFLKSQLDNFNQVEPGREMRAYKITDAPEQVLTNLKATFEKAGWVSDTPGVVLSKNDEALKTQNSAASLTFVKEEKIAFVFIYPLKFATQLGISEVGQNDTLVLVGIANKG